jgi:hypothetical protein
MTVQVDIYWLAGLVSVLLAYRPVFVGVVAAFRTALRAYEFAQSYVDLPSYVSRNTDAIKANSDSLHELELRVDDLEAAVFPG